jgi:hypothetical protein
MLEFLRRLLEPDFLPHGTFYLWPPVVLWLNVISGLAISLAYYAIAVLAVLVFAKTPGCEIQLGPLGLWRVHPGVRHDAPVGRLDA